jgi:Zn-dependent protease
MVSWALRIGRIYGVEVRVDASALAIVALLAWGLSDGVLPELASGYTTREYWFAGVLVAVAFFASLLAHELSHAAVARSRGIEVRDITLWLFGGVATIEGEPKTPNDELAVAVAGPATSIAVGVVALVGSALLAVLEASALVVAALGWLGFINLILAVFNLVPAAPLDGGRILRAVMWRRYGDRSRGVRSAAAAGEVFGRVLIALGILELWLGAGLSGIWSALIGWFVLMAARSEREAVDLEEALTGRRVRDVMTSNPITAPSTITVADLLDGYVLRHHCSAFPLVDAGGAVVGLATLARMRTVPESARASTAAADIAWPVAEVTTAAPDEPLPALLRRIAGGDGRVLVFDAGHLVGILSPSDISRLLQAVRA